MKYIHKYKKYALHSQKVAHEKGLNARVTGNRGHYITTITPKRRK